MSPTAPLFSALRTVGKALVGKAVDPAAELYALVWGPRFDRDHANTLVQMHLQPSAQMLQTLLMTADSFDALSGARQQRLRQAIRSRAFASLTTSSATISA